ncbi:hypothetical protein OBBRIDRAFT_782700 [Obba rivulosa]|uniref:AAA protein C-terminal winged helix domain-containing protein n=1 Tax=Obba rivulosa TaxID=1052685 RepID=A0A8E2ALE2_9APHY|nr:hypothetical protein OBBRIDRAFT_782700 [Obba rivulosa]
MSSIGGGQVLSNFVDAVVTTAIGIVIVFLSGAAYFTWYSKNVLDKIERAFAPGYDAAFELANYARKKDVQTLSQVFEASVDNPWTQHLRRKEQEYIDRIIQGKESGAYFMLLGPKGTGKTSMILSAMQAVRGEGVVICEMHPDLEVFRLRLGKALNFQYFEDSQTVIFQRRNPRDGGPALDIERALNKLEIVALRYVQKRNRPLVLVMNNIQLCKNNTDSKHLLTQIQQRAESWAASGILTVVLSTDDFWPFLHMHRTASRMHVLSVWDLDSTEAVHAAMRLRLIEKRPVTEADEFRQAVSITGGRLVHLTKVARAVDMLGMAQRLLQAEKAWLLSNIGLIIDCDDGALEDQRFSSCSWLLLREFVRMRKEDEKRRQDAIESGILGVDAAPGLPLPNIPYYVCRQIMTRPDYIERLDQLNVIAIDVYHGVVPESELLLNAARETVDEEQFDVLLEQVRHRVSSGTSETGTKEPKSIDVPSS